MTSEKTLYWIAVALLAVFLGNHFANKYQGRCLADRAMATIQHLSGQVSAVSRAMFQDNSKVFRLAMARMQGQFAAMEAAKARRQVACSRAQAQHARLMVLRRMQHIPVVYLGRE